MNPTEMKRIRYRANRLEEALSEVMEWYIASNDPAIVLLGDSVHMLRELLGYVDELEAAIQMAEKALGNYISLEEPTAGSAESDARAFGLKAQEVIKAIVAALASSSQFIPGVNPNDIDLHDRAMRN